MDSNVAAPTQLPAVGRLHPADVAALLQELPVSETAKRLSEMPLDEAVAALNQPEFDHAAQALALISPAKAVALVSRLSDDRAADVLAAMGDDNHIILASLPAEIRRSLTALMAWPADSAGGMMTTEYISIRSPATVKEALRHVTTVKSSREAVYAILLTDEEGKLFGTISLRTLVAAAPETSLMELASDEPVAVMPLTDREVVIDLIRRHDLLGLPVIDEDRRPIGIVTVDDVLDALVAEHTEDAHKFGGLEALRRPYLDIGFASMFRKRAGWLSVLFLSEMLTASVMQHFEAELEKAIVLTLFIPLIMSSGGNSGSQATSLIIRALALGQLQMRDWWRVAFRELPTGLALGGLLGLIGFARMGAPLAERTITSKLPVEASFPRPPGGVAAEHAS